MKDHKDNKITWQAFTVMKVEQECIDSGKFPNGKKMKESDIEQSKELINICKNILINYGCIDTQLTLFPPTV